MNCAFKQWAHSELQSRNKTFYSYGWGWMHIRYLEGFHDSIYHEQFQSLPQTPTSPPPCLAMSLLPCGERLARQTAQCGATTTSSCWEWDLTCETTTYTHSLTHVSWCNMHNTTSQRCLCAAGMLGQTNPKSTVKSQEYAQEDVQSLNKTFILSWEVGFLFHWYVLKYTQHWHLPIQRQQRQEMTTGKRDILQNTPKEQPTKL